MEKVVSKLVMFSLNYKTSGHLKNEPVIVYNIWSFNIKVFLNLFALYAVLQSQ